MTSESDLSHVYVCGGACNTCVECMCVCVGKVLLEHSYADSLTCCFDAPVVILSSCCRDHMIHND